MWGAFILHINIERVSTFAIIVITLALFIAAVFTKGFTHDIFLEAAVFLVSVKVIFLTFRNNVIARDMQKKLSDMHDSLQRIETYKSSKTPDKEA